ncbi:uncharacterized protein VP01_6306g1, partial [Puccinia sorghi]
QLVTQLIEERAYQNCNILGQAISDRIFNIVINDKNEEMLYGIWITLKQIYSGDSFLLVYRTWNKWMSIKFNKAINQFITRVEKRPEQAARMASITLEPHILKAPCILKKILDLASRDPQLKEICQSIVLDNH